ncbi:MAG: DUF1667 domain-containing protein [Candidatus Bathyarchaeota archaeon]|nr:DUF1667 domain-containing protein [Candidatus Bathyarchaeota archaeon]
MSSDLYNGASGSFRRITCIICPLGCSLKVLLKDDEVILVEGNRCQRGVIYARDEVKPKRTLITVVKVYGGVPPVVSVKTSKPVPKDLISEAMKIISKISVKAPVKIGDIIIRDLLGLGVDVVATRGVEAV